MSTVENSESAGQKTHTVQEAVLCAAYKWWEELRPPGWSIQQHLQHPTVNTTNVWQHFLATSVAQWVAEDADFSAGEEAST